LIVLTFTPLSSRSATGLSALAPAQRRSDFVPCARPGPPMEATLMSAA
jgi:hypothetical protein